MRPSTAVAIAGGFLLGCGFLSPDLDRIIAIEVQTPSVTVDIGDSAQLLAHAISAGGTVIESVPVVWAILDTGIVGFSLDTTGLVIGIEPDTGHVQASIEGIRSEPIIITVIDPQPVPGATQARVQRSVSPESLVGLSRGRGS